MTCIAKLLRIIINVFLEPVFLPFLSLRGRNLKGWNNDLYLLRKRVRSNDPSSNLALIANARALVGNVSGNLSLVIFGVRRGGAHNM